MRYRFGDYILDTQLYELRQRDQLIKVEPQVFKVLAYLVQHRERIVSQAELLSRLWPERFSGDAVLTRCIWVARQALGDSGRRQRVIQTVPRRGYRFITPVTETDSQGPEQAIPVPEGMAEGDAGLLPQAPLAAPPVVSSSTVPQDERKFVTVLCGRWRSDWGLDQNIELDALHETWQEVSTAVRDVASTYDGTIQELTSQRVVIVFGAPIMQEDHAARAIFTARELHRLVEARSELEEGLCDGHLELCVGMSSGPVALRLNEAELGGITPVVGEALSLAVVLANEASPGSIYLSAFTAPLVTEYATFSPNSPLCLEGYAAPIESYRLAGDVARLAPMGQAKLYQDGPFVGREEELNTLRRYLCRVLNGAGQIVGIVGEAGIGKSRLLYEFRQYAVESGAACLVGQCQPYGRTTLYLPLIDLVRAHCQIRDVSQVYKSAEAIRTTLRGLGIESELWTQLLLRLCQAGEVEGGVDHLDPQEYQDQLVAALQAIFLQSSRSQPLVIIVEDLQWIDSASEVWIREFAARLTGVPLLLLLTYRAGYQPTWLGMSCASQLALLPLSPESSSQIVETCLPPMMDPVRLQKHIVSQAGGNPFFLEELSRVVSEQELPEVGPAVPETIQFVLLARIDQLPAAAKRLLQTAAVIGPEIDAALLRALVDVRDDLFQESLLYLQSSGFWVETQVVPRVLYTFQHPLMQDVAYQSMLRATQQGLHRKIAEVLTAQFPNLIEAQPELVARHYADSGCPELALTYWQQAGEQAAQRCAYVDAIMYWTQGLESLALLSRDTGTSCDELALRIDVARAYVATKGRAAPEVLKAYT